MAALSAPSPSNYTIQSVVLVSPPLSVFRLSTLLAPKTFSTALRALLDRTDAGKKGTPVWIIHGTKDDFTGSSAYDALDEQMREEGLVVRRIEGAEHFYKAEEHAKGLEAALREWLDS